MPQQATDTTHLRTPTTGSGRDANLNLNNYLESQVNNLINLELRPEDKGMQEGIRGKENNPDCLKAKAWQEIVKSEGTNATLDGSPEDKESSEKTLSKEDFEGGAEEKIPSIIRQALPRESCSVPTYPKLPPQSAICEPTHKIRDIVLVAFVEGGQYFLSVLKVVGYMSRWPIAFGMTSFLLMIVIGYISRSVRQAFEPLCIIPGISLLSVCNLPSATVTPEWVGLVNMQSDSFSEILKSAAGGSALALEIKRAELVTRDLIVLVRLSDLNEKLLLEMSLSGFVADARKAGESLQELSSMVSGSVDNVNAVNDYALQSIAYARANEPAPWSLWRVVYWNFSAQTEKVVTRVFKETMSVLSSNMDQLIATARHNLKMLNNLESQLANLHDIVAHEDSTVSSAKSDLLEHLWTKLGGNRKSLKSSEQKSL